MSNRTTRNIYEDGVVKVDISYETVKGKQGSVPFIHCLYKETPTPKNIKIVRHQFSEAKEQLKTEGHTHVFAYTDNHHYISMIDPGYKRIGRYKDDRDGINKDLVVWDL